MIWPLSARATSSSSPVSSSVGIGAQRGQQAVCPLLLLCRERYPVRIQSHDFCFSRDLPVTLDQRSQGGLFDAKSTAQGFPWHPLAQGIFPVKLRQGGAQPLRQAVPVFSGKPARPGQTDQQSLLPRLIQGGGEGLCAKPACRLKITLGEWARPARGKGKALRRAAIGENAQALQDLVPVPLPVTRGMRIQNVPASNRLCRGRPAQNEAIAVCKLQRIGEAQLQPAALSGKQFLARQQPRPGDRLGSAGEELDLGVMAQGV